MSASPKKIPNPEERPDLYDDYDGRPGGISQKEASYWDDLMPDYIKNSESVKNGGDKDSK